MKLKTYFQTSVIKVFSLIVDWRGIDQTELRFKYFNNLKAEYQFLYVFYSQEKLNEFFTELQNIILDTTISFYDCITKATSLVEDFCKNATNMKNSDE